MSAPSLRLGRLLLPLFFLSGGAALIYQMIWQRVLTLFSGADVHSVTLIVAAFMAGLGFGSLAGGHLADRLGLRQRFLAFAAAELGVAAFALVSLRLYYGLLFRRLGEQPWPFAVVALALFLTLLVPTFLMGLSLPLLASTIGPTGKRPEDWVGQLYGFNTLGAATGALVAVWYLARFHGFEVSVNVAAALNGLCALGALLLARRVQDGPPARSESLPEEPVARLPGGLGFGGYLALFALSGFVALSLEIVWFRLLGIMLKSNAFTFATLLCVYLLGVGGGALLGSRRARSSRRPAGTFLLIQALVPVCAVLALAALVAGLQGWPPLSGLRQYLGGYETLDLRRTLPALAAGLAWQPLAPEQAPLVRTFLQLYLLLPLLLFGIPTLLMGLAFPFLQKAAQTDPSALGWRVGALQAANIVGCTVGSLLTGLGLLAWLGTAGTLRLLVACGIAFGLLWAGYALKQARRQALAGGALLLLLQVTALVLSPDGGRLWAALHGADPGDVLFGEDGSGLSLLRFEPQERRTVVFAGGLGQSLLPYGGEHTLLGALPVLLHPSPRRVLIVGLGSGDTLFAAGARRETESLTCVEIVAPQLPTLRRLAALREDAGLRSLLEDTRVRHVVGDGRVFLMRSPVRYDVIEADALRPTSAWAGALYSREYFELLRARLAPGGYAVSWGPTPRVEQTFRAVFPHVLEIGQMLVGSEGALPYDLVRLRARLEEPFTRERFAHARVDLPRLLDELLARSAVSSASATPWRAGADLDTDLYPRDEYLAPRRGPRQR